MPTRNKRRYRKKNKRSRSKKRSRRKSTYYSRKIKKKMKKRLKNIRKKLKKSACKNYRKKSKYIRKYKKKSKKHRRIQLGCSKQKGGNCTDRSCEYPKNMGEIMTGTPNNLHYADLTPRTTQNRHPNAQLGGGFGGLGTSKLIDFGGSGLLTAARDGVNHLYNYKRTWDADRHIVSADPVVKSDRMDNN